MLFLPGKNLCSSFAKELLITCSIYSVFIFVGVCRSYSSFLIIQLRQTGTPIRLTIDEESWVATFSILPALFGSLFNGLLSDKIGRKLSFQIIFPVSFAGWLIIGLAVNVYMLYVGMFLNGFVTGMSNSCTVYVAEISSPKNRGFMLSFILIFFGVGIVTCNLLSYYFGWRLSAFSSCLMVVVFFVASVFLPESPTWLINKGRKEKAISILRWLRDTEEQTKCEIQDLESRRSSDNDANNSSNSNNNNSNNSIKGLTGITNLLLSNWRQLLLAAVLLSFQQSSGFSTLLAYNVSFLEQLTVPIDVSTASLLYVVVFFVSTWSIPFVNFYFKRRLTLMIGCLCCSLSFACMVAYEMIFSSTEHPPCSWLVLVFLYSTVVVGVNSVIPLPFVMYGELFPNEGRGLLTGVSFLIGFVLITIIIKLFLFGLYRFGIVSVLSAFATSSLAFALFTFFLVPETKGKTFNEIQEKYFKKQRRNIANVMPK